MQQSGKPTGTAPSGPSRLCAWVKSTAGGLAVDDPSFRTELCEQDDPAGYALGSGASRRRPPLSAVGLSTGGQFSPAPRMAGESQTAVPGVVPVWLTGPSSEIS